jgi:hypothetical protein
MKKPSFQKEFKTPNKGSSEKPSPNTVSPESLLKPALATGKLESVITATTPLDDFVLLNPVMMDNNNSLKHF